MNNLLRRSNKKFNKKAQGRERVQVGMLHKGHQTEAFYLTRNHNLSRILLPFKNPNYHLITTLRHN